MRVLFIYFMAGLATVWFAGMAAWLAIAWLFGF